MIAIRALVLIEYNLTHIKTLWLNDCKQPINKEKCYYYYYY